MIGGGYLAAGALALSVASGIAAYSHGVETGRQREHKEAQALVDKANAERDRLRGLMEQGALKHLEADALRQSTHQEIVRETREIVDRPVYRNVCIDADGVHLLDRLEANANDRRAGPPAGPAR